MLENEGAENLKTPLSPQPSFPIAWRKREPIRYKILLWLKGVLSSAPQSTGCFGQHKGEGFKRIVWIEENFGDYKRSV
jgi:hypothetical protein